MYLYLLYTVTVWFMALPEPSPSQAGLVSVIVGVGAAWFGIYVNGTPTKHTEVLPTIAGSAVAPRPVTPVATRQPKAVATAVPAIDVAKPTTTDSYDSEYER